jgi:hypothetical protein
MIRKKEEKRRKSGEFRGKTGGFGGETGDFRGKKKEKSRSGLSHVVPIGTKTEAKTSAFTSVTCLGEALAKTGANR